MRESRRLVSKLESPQNVDLRPRSLSREQDLFRVPKSAASLTKTGLRIANLTLHLTLQLFCLLVALGDLY
jgi:hypothetical protein